MNLIVPVPVFYVQELHNEGKYNDNWDKFFSDSKENFKGMTQSAKQAAIDAHLEDLKADPRYKDILQAGADVPKGLDYNAYSEMSKTPAGRMVKSFIIQKSFAAKKAGQVLEWMKPAAKFTSEVPMAGALIGSGLVFASGKAQGEDDTEIKKEMIMTVTGGDIAKWALEDSSFGKGLQVLGDPHKKERDEIDAMVNGTNGQQQQDAQSGEGK